MSCVYNSDLLPRKVLVKMSSKSVNKTKWENIKPDFTTEINELGRNGYLIFEGYKPNGEHKENLYLLELVFSPELVHVTSVTIQGSNFNTSHILCTADLSGVVILGELNLEAAAIEEPSNGAVTTNNAPPHQANTLHQANEKDTSSLENSSIARLSKDAFYVFKIPVLQGNGEPYVSNRIFLVEKNRSTGLRHRKITVQGHCKTSCGGIEWRRVSQFLDKSEFLNREDAFSDFTFVFLNGKKIFAHRILLHRCKYFELLFSSSSLSRRLNVGGSHSSISSSSSSSSSFSNWNQTKEKINNEKDNDFTQDHYDLEDYLENKALETRSTSYFSSSSSKRPSSNSETNETSSNKKHRNDHGFASKQDRTDGNNKNIWAKDNDRVFDFARIESEERNRGEDKKYYYEATLYILSYLYSGKILKNEPVQVLTTVVELARSWMISELLAECEKKLIPLLTFENILLMYYIALD